MTDQPRPTPTATEIADRYGAAPLPEEYWRRLREREAEVRAKLMDLEARLIGRRLDRPDQREGIRAP